MLPLLERPEAKINGDINYASREGTSKKSFYGQILFVKYLPPMNRKLVLLSIKSLPISIIMILLTAAIDLCVLTSLKVLICIELFIFIVKLLYISFSFKYCYLHRYLMYVVIFICEGFLLICY